MTDRDEKERVSKIPGHLASGRDPDDPTWGVSSTSYANWGDAPTAERKLALSDAAFLDELSASFLTVRVREKGAGTRARATAQQGTQEFLQRAERLHAIAQRLRGMQP